ncbi:MAG TPA: acyl carrier protein [Candidatus Fimivicinus intestinavium]|nr:acyl carrier protein [Candidatus Fimivicinus intestinavium]
MLEQLLEILRELKPDVEFEGQKRLFDDGLLDSLDIVSLVSEIDDAFDVEITVTDLQPENFNSVEAMLALIERLQGE